MRAIMTNGVTSRGDEWPVVVHFVAGALSHFVTLPVLIRPSPRPLPPVVLPLPFPSRILPARAPSPSDPSGVCVSRSVEGSSSRDTHTTSHLSMGTSGVPPPNLEGSNRHGTPEMTSSSSAWIYESAGIAWNKAVLDPYVQHRRAAAVARPSNDLLPADESAPKLGIAAVDDEDAGADSPVDVCDDHGGSRSSQAHRSTCRPALLTPTAAWSARSASASFLRVPT